MNIRTVLLIFLLGFITLLAQSKPPVAPVKEKIDEYWGQKVSDPYRYMENLDDPKVKQWMKEQAEYTQNILSKIQGRDALFQRIKELYTSKPVRIFNINRNKSGSMYYEKITPNDNLPKLYFRDINGAEKLLLDPEKIKSKDKQHFSLEFYAPSPDEKYLVYGLAKGGSEQTTVFIKNIKTGKDLPEKLDRIETAYNIPVWLPDGSGFLYSRRQKLPPDAPATEIYKNTKAYYHKLGEDPEKDVIVLAEGYSKNVKMTDVDFPSVNILKESNYIVGKIKHGDANEIDLCCASIDEIKKNKINWIKICDSSDEVTDYSVIKDNIYLLTSKNAPRFKVVMTSLSNPNFQNSAVIVPESDVVVSSIATAKDALYIEVMDGGFNRIQRIDYNDNKIETLKLPDDAAGYIESASQNINGILIYTIKWTKGGAIYSYEPLSKKFTNTELMPKGEFDDVPGFESHEVKVKSHDGVMVPLSIIYKSDIKMDGSNPALMIGYGSYGFSETVFFSSVYLAWLEKGGVLAIAHVRGGGEYGKEWHMAGQKLNKPNTWKDFIACAEYLIQKKYTSKKLLAGEGGSAGGILIGRSITERPDLFSAAIINVGDLDALRAETTTNGVPNIAEFGTVKDKNGFKGLYEMSAYHHVKNGIKYPAVMLTTGINDPRVDPWNSAKMTARLQAATSSNKPILLRIDYDAGHGFGSTIDQRLKGFSDELSFLFWQFGVKGFQLVNAPKKSE